MVIQQVVTERLKEHDELPYDVRRRNELAICSFLAERMQVTPREVSIADVRRFIGFAVMYRPLMEALNQDRCYG